MQNVRGLCFMLQGNMSFGVVEANSWSTFGPDSYAEALALPHAREMDFTGPWMRGMVFVSEDGNLER